MLVAVRVRRMAHIMPSLPRERHVLPYTSCAMTPPVTVASSPQTLAERDLRVVWHPCTQMKDHEWLPMVPIARGEGVWLYGLDGRRYLDAISSWWVNLFGHSNPRINARLAAALEARARHARRLHARTGRATRRAPDGARADGPHRCFYADNGSSAIEVALKMSFHYWRNAAARKRRFVTLVGSYHGETLGALAVGNVELYKEIYQPLLMDVITAPRPTLTTRARRDGRSVRARHVADGAAARAARRRNVRRHRRAARAVRGRHAHARTALRRAAARACDRHGVHLIADEIAVGFGRTGTLFALRAGRHHAGLPVPVQGLTGGYLPLSVVLTGDECTRRSMTNTRTARFLHSHSYTGNALACTQRSRHWTSSSPMTSSSATAPWQCTSAPLRRPARGARPRGRSSPGRHDRRGRAGSRWRPAPAVRLA
jgi:adenosylmethionine-8-amino-7-oxononanoate aminotransferase